MSELVVVKRMGRFKFLVIVLILIFLVGRGWIKISFQKDNLARDAKLAAQWTKTKIEEQRNKNDASLRQASQEVQQITL